MYVCVYSLRLLRDTYIGLWGETTFQNEYAPLILNKHTFTSPTTTAAATGGGSSPFGDRHWPFTARR